MATPASIIEWLTERFPQAKKTTLREMVAQKRVRLNGVPVRSLKQALKPGDKLEVADATGPTGKIAEGLRIVFQDADVFVVDKPAGLLTSTHSEEPRPTAVQILTDYVQGSNQKAQLHLVHRLDRDASGLLVFARTTTALAKLKKQFAEHSVSRQYSVVVHGVFRQPKGRLENLLYEDNRGMVHVSKRPQSVGPRSRRTGPRGARPESPVKKAVMDFEVLKATVRLTMLRCTLHTGRKHQIRVQLKAIGHPVCGDEVYGTEAAQAGEEAPGRLALHAMHLAFVHPGTGKRVTFDSPVPPAFNDLMPI